MTKKKRKKRNKTAPKIITVDGAVINLNANKNANLIIGIDKKTLNVIAAHLLPVQLGTDIYFQPGIIVEDGGTRKYYSLPRTISFQEWCYSEINAAEKGLERLLPNKIEFWKEGENYHLFASNPPHPAENEDS